MVKLVAEGSVINVAYPVKVPSKGGVKKISLFWREEKNLWEITKFYIITIIIKLHYDGDKIKSEPSPKIKFKPNKKGDMKVPGGL